MSEGAATRATRALRGALSGRGSLSGRGTLIGRGALKSREAPSGRGTPSGSAVAGPARDLPGSETGSVPQRRVRALLAVAATVLAADIISKAIVVATLSDRSPVRLLGGFLTLRVTRNSGAAFSIGPSLTIVFSAIAVGVIVFILRASRRIMSLPWAVTLGLLLGGATGNLADRLLRSPGPFVGHVVDWIQVPHWPVFNIADSSIVCGGVLAVFLATRGVRLDGVDHAGGTGGTGGGDGE